MKIQEEDKKVITEALRSAGCCTVCILRLLGEKDFSSFENLELLDKNSADSLEEIRNEDKSEEPLPKRQCIGGCITCLGILEKSFLEMSIRKVLKAVETSGHKFLSFVIQLSLPVTLDVRHHSVTLFLKDKFSSFYENIDEEDLLSVKEAWKFFIGPLLTKRFDVDFSVRSGFQIAVTVTHSDVERECGFLLKELPGAFPNRRQKDPKLEIFTRASVSKALKLVSDETFKRWYPVPPKNASSLPEDLTVNCVHQPIYLAGRYCKYSRNLCQTPWIIDGEKRMDTSVQEIIVDVVKEKVPNDKIVFSSSGREDVDVRMLGKGRPFILEIFNPREIQLTKNVYETMETEINKSLDVKVNNLQLVSKESTQILKEGEDTKTKTYLALCCINRPITDADVQLLNSQKSLVLKQKTPLRVLHRRPLAVRERTIHNMSVEVLKESLFNLRVVTQAGTYVKEFVHGDLKRTSPSLGDLLKAEVDIVELDVEEVNLDWPLPRS